MSRVVRATINRVSAFDSPSGDLYIVNYYDLDGNEVFEESKFPFLLDAQDDVRLAFNDYHFNGINEVLELVQCKEYDEENDFWEYVRADYF